MNSKFQSLLAVPPDSHFHWKLLIRGSLIRSVAFLLSVSASVACSSLWAQAPKPVEVSSAWVLTPDTGPQAQARDYLISPDDMLEVYVLDVPELSRTYRVSATGAVAIPLLSDRVLAAGLTLDQFSDALAKQLKTTGVVSNPHVTTSVQQSRAHAVTIAGAVKSPQIYPVLGRTTLLDVVTQAGGLADDAGNTAIIQRSSGAVQSVNLGQSTNPMPDQPGAAGAITVDLRRILESGDPNTNVDIYPGDRITVPRAGVVYVVGAVNKPGVVTMRSRSGAGITVLEALAAVEDVKSTALRSKAMIIRGDGLSPGQRTEIPLDLKRVLAGKAQDPRLLANDILFVPDSSSKKALRRGAEAALQVATMLAIIRP